MNHTRISRRDDGNTRLGSLLILVLVIVAVLTLGAYSFSDMMISEVEATAMFGRQAESRALADSGIELVAAIIAKPESVNDDNLYHNPQRFQSVVIRDGGNARSRAMLSIIAPLESDPLSKGVRFGLSDESAKINLNTLLKLGLDETQTRTMLMSLPDMTEDIADAILDWLDEDDTPREFGVESEYYEGLTPSFKAANGNFKSLDELLQVAGVTPDLLYGEDANRNGLLDPNEDDADISPPFDNKDGALQLGWMSYLTIDSKESNLRLDGTKRINVNDGLLTELYDKLEEEFDEDVARFVVAFRTNGPMPDPNQQQQQQQSGVNPTGQAGSGGGNKNGTGGGTNSRSGGTGGNAGSSSNNSSNSNSSSSSGGSNSSTSNSSNGQSGNSDPQLSTSQVASAANSLGKALGGGIAGAVTRGGLDLTPGGKFEPKSIYELIGARVETKVNGQTTQLESPWSADGSQMRTYLPDLLERLTVFKDDQIQGRININQARYEVLLGLPNMTEEIAQGISSASIIGGDGQVIADQIEQRANTGWLLTQGIVDLPTMVKLDRYVTAKGSVARAQVIGYFQEGGGFTRLEAVIDATKTPATILSVRDLTDLGRGYPTDVLTGAATSGGSR